MRGFCQDNQAPSRRPSHLGTHLNRARALYRQLTNPDYIVLLLQQSSSCAVKRTIILNCFTTTTVLSFTMPPLFRPVPSTLPRIIRRLYSTPSTPLIKVLDVPAPGSGRIRILSLARPAARNAISRALLQELRHNVDSIHSEYAEDGSEIAPEGKFGGAAGKDERRPTRAVVLCSEVEQVFCAGADLKERAGMSKDE